MTLLKRLQNRIIYHTILKGVEFLNRKKDYINPGETILVFSNPRGGSTWMAEILNEIPKSVVVWEPLFKTKLKGFSNLDFHWHQPIPAGTVWPEARAEFKKLLNRENLALSLYFKNNLVKVPFAEKYIFKFCYGNMLMEWLTENFNVNPVFVVRHPCAVVASQLQHGGWNHLKERPFYKIPAFPFNETYLKYKDTLDSVKTIEENLAATWALTMSNSLLSKANDKKWITVSYENLYSNYEFEIERIFKRLMLAIPQEVYSKRKIPSSTSIKSSESKIKGGIQLESWKKVLSKTQQENVFRIVKEFGIECYNSNPEPDLKKMYNYNPS